MLLGCCVIVMRQKSNKKRRQLILITVKNKIATEWVSLLSEKICHQSEELRVGPDQHEVYVVIYVGDQGKQQNGCSHRQSITPPLSLFLGHFAAFTSLSL